MRAEKQFLLDEVKEKIDGSKGFIIARYRDLTARRVREFRDIIAAASGDFEVVRKKVFVKAAEASGINLSVDDFEGHIGVIFANEDAHQLTKVAVKFGEDNEKSIEVLGGHIDGELCSAEDMEAIAKLPSLPEMRAQFLGLLEAPMGQTLATFQAILTSILYCMDEKEKKDQE